MNKDYQQNKISNLILKNKFKMKLKKYNFLKNSQIFSSHNKSIKTRKLNIYLENNNKINANLVNQLKLILIKIIMMAKSMKFQIQMRLK